jgi:hypothetical protein
MGIEPDAKDLLKRVALSLFLGLCWLLVNMTLGIYFDLLPVYGRPDLPNILYYLFLLGTGVLYGIFLYRTWKKKIPHG